MCHSVEVMRTHELPAITPGFSAWVRPLTGGDSNLAFDASGVSGTAADLSCGGWTDPGATGLTMNSAGNLGLAPCNSSARVACCSEIPEPSPVVLALWPGRGLLAALILSVALGTPIRTRRLRVSEVLRLG